MLGFIGLAASLLNKIIPDKTERDKYQLKLLELEQQGEFKDQEMQYQAIFTEAKSEDKWVARARPTFLYVIYFIVVLSVPIGALYAFYPLIIDNFINGFKLWLHAIPEPMWGLFGTGYLGYGAMRSYDKKIKNQ
jgi:hypothetical protein